MPLGSETTAVTKNSTVFTTFGSVLGLGISIVVTGTVTFSIFGRIFPNKKFAESEILFVPYRARIERNTESFAVDGITLLIESLLLKNFLL